MATLSPTFIEGVERENIYIFPRSVFVLIPRYFPPWMSEGTISETPLFRSAFSTSSPFCRIPTRNEKREKYNTHASSFLHTRLSFAPCHFIQQRRERFVSTPRPQQPFKPFLVRQKSIVEKIQSPLFSISFLPFVFFNYTVDTPSNRRGEGKRYKKKKKKRKLHFKE